jgi:hypothetical protein
MAGLNGLNKERIRQMEIMLIIAIVIIGGMFIWNEIDSIK